MAALPIEWLMAKKKKKKKKKKTFLDPQLRWKQVCKYILLQFFPHVFDKYFVTIIVERIER